MLAGMQDTVDSLFPSLRELTPSADELRDGAMRLKAGKVVRLAGYKTEIFDIHSAKDRKAYDKRMADLMQRIQVGRVRILQHDRQVLSRKDGSSGWFIYLEWAEYRLDDEQESK